MGLPLGQHFLDPQKDWANVAYGKSIPFVEVAQAVPTWGYSVPAAIERMQIDHYLLRDSRCHPMPYLRLDYADGLTVNDVDGYYQAFADVARLWLETGITHPLTVIVGNEWIADWEGSLQPRHVALVLAKLCQIRTDLSAHHIRLFAPAAIPWYPVNVDDVEWQEVGFFPGPSREDKNHMFALAARCAALPIDGYAMHAYSRATWDYGAYEPFTDYYDDRTNQQWGFRTYREFLDAKNAGDPRKLPVFISEMNSRSDNEHPSSQTYVMGLMRNMMAELAHVPEIEGAAWFVGTGRGGWLDESLQARTGMLWAADDNFNDYQRQ